MSNEDRNRQPTVAEVEEQKRLAQRDKQAQVMANSLGAEQPKELPQQPTTGGEGIVKVILKTDYLNIEITDPNILAELNTPEKYAQNIPFKGLEINVNPHGARVVLKTEDRKEVLRDAMSGVARLDMQDVKHFVVERGPNAPMIQPTQ